MSAPLTDAESLHARLQRVGRPLALGVDTEFLRERTYFAQLCLLQLSTADDAFCVDTLALQALQPVAALTADASVCKVLHAARQDLEVLTPVTGPLRNVFDTQIAAALLGFPAQVGYGDLVSQLLNVQLHKAHTRTDWSQRPLSPEQLEYALDDVRYLLPLRELRLLRALAADLVVRVHPAVVVIHAELVEILSGARQHEEARAIGQGRRAGREG